MKHQRGFTVVELLVASAVMLIVLAAAAGALHDAVARLPVLEETTDLHQRTRVAVELLASDLRSAGAGVTGDPPGMLLAAVMPRGSTAPQTLADLSVLTVRHAPDGAATSRLQSGLMPPDTMASLLGGAPCVASAVACGFVAGTTAVVFDPAGSADTLSVSGAGSGVIQVTNHLVPRSSAYAAGAFLSELVEVTYLHDPATRTLRREQNGASVPIADNVTELEFSYLGAAERPREPRPPLGIANCLYAADGTYLHPTGLRLSSLQPLPLNELVDGPWCGTGRLAFDIDLLRVRAVEVRIRLDTGDDRLRGTDPALFARPGRAQDSRVIPDVIRTFAVTLRNHAR